MEFVYHYTSGKLLRKILRSGRLIPSNYSPQESTVWFSKSKNTPSCIVPMRIDNMDARKWYKVNHNNPNCGYQKFTFHPKQMKGIYRFAFPLDTSGIIKFVGSPLYLRMKNNILDGNGFYSNGLERMILTTGCEDIEDWYYSTEPTVSLSNASLDKLKESNWVLLDDLDLKTVVYKIDNKFLQSPNYDGLSDIIFEDTGGHWIDVPKYPKLAEVA